MYSIVQPDPIAQEQIIALPDDALLYLSDAFKLLQLAPWSGDAFDPANPAGNLRTLKFGGRGLMTYLVLEPQREVYITRVQWI
ncbi:hypothetical protein C1I98_13170 [Spongiactinospora gelatinilytica]|uniref:Uncharacterized protein n=1 Tax=Spongiactinospora gelatinilytica TaxID=2666298 RepID=A0A2W2H6K5_9ACTN|nr:hypothetical protein [Spongiactinospora gelatinilytica]PZG47585.1 hypothetical protein C1I98_13170 [Spongiactinospora gelatinilytica]